MAEEYRPGRPGRGLRGWLARRAQIRTNQRRYAFHESQCRTIRAHLARVVDPGDRADMLRRLATSLHRRAVLYASVHGVHQLEGETTTADLSMLWEADLYEALCDVEAAHVYHTPRARGMDQIEETAGPVLDRMAATPDLGGRLRLLGALHDSVLPVVGKRAAAQVRALPAPASVVTAGR
ncbi:hypothetical protein [Micromonospora costi]|uniref:Uncharacterized protein n=1 Tax=Micromonospora costi TaxID=1530042 RepID=A0A3B0A739_9ACTN|nr:hypothetical protein [Micromonospora costi]RKN56004.1 hypothetical protein D7193_15580 [Micromonospora costi]